MWIDMMHAQLIPSTFGRLYNRLPGNHSFSITVWRKRGNFKGTHLAPVGPHTILSISIESVFETSYSSSWSSNFRVSSDYWTVRMLMPRAEQIVCHKEMETFGSCLT